jgi:choline dehydrogenase-like flavoprotein
MSIETYDAVVIGAGAGGAAAAWALSSAGAQVLVLEAGPEYTIDDYRLHRNDWERGGFPHKRGGLGRHSAAPLQALNKRFEDLRSYNQLTGAMVRGEQRAYSGYAHARGLGGSTLVFTGEAQRLNPAAMQLATRFGVGADWPIDYVVLEPFYEEVESIIGVAGTAADASRPRRGGFPLPAHPLSYASQQLGRGCNALGLSWTANPLAALSQPYDGRPGCNYCGNCARGCPRRDKGSADVTFVPKARASGRCNFRTGAAVTRLLAGADDRVAEVHYADTGGAHAVHGRAVLMACGAVDTPRLLLHSRGAHAPQGLGNEDGQLGRHFMETLHFTSSALHPEPLGSYRGLPSDAICWDFNKPDAIDGVVGGARFTPGMAEADLVGPINHARRAAGGWGRAHKQRMADTFGRVLSVGAIGENLPDAGSFIDLDPDHMDAHGVPIARIHSHLGDMELRRLRFMANTCRAILDAAGAGKPFEEYGVYDQFLSTHVFGGCRMGRDARASVVDANCRSHRWKNLFVVDASVFPSTGGGESPSLTIEALAVRAGRHVAGLMSRKEL